jgi:hypothetical protein
MFVKYGSWRNNRSWGTPALLVRVFFPKLEFFVDFLYTSLISPGGSYSEMGGGAQRPVLHVHVSKRRVAKRTDA